MSNREVAQAFANGQLASGSNFYTEHVDIGNNVRFTVLRSYSTPVAIRKPDGCVFFDARKYSVTTGKQVRYAKGAVSPGYQDDMEHSEFRQLCRDIGVYLGGAR